MNFIHKFKFMLSAPASRRLSQKFPMPEVMDDETTLGYILKNGCSVCRFGDGEFNLMRGVGIKFQDADKELSSRLSGVAANKDQNVLVCIPDVFRTLDFYMPDDKKWWKNYLRCTRGFWYRDFYADGARYGDTNISRFYAERIPSMRRGAEYVEKLKRLWNGKRLLIVEGEKSRMGMGNDLFAGAASIKRLLCPSKNAFFAYDKILAATQREVETGNYDLMICALGPTATVLCYDMSKSIQALDLGHVDIEYEWFLAKAEGQQAVSNKAVTEVTDVCGNDVTEQYGSQIIGVIN